MYLSHLSIRNFRQFGEANQAFELAFRKGITALVGRNDAGKTAIVDAIRYALLTRDQEYIRVQPEDFHIDEAKPQANEISICCKLSSLTEDEKAAFVEYLSYDGPEVSLIVNWNARRLSESPGSRRWVDVSVRSGKEGAGPSFEASVRELLSAAYLRPLRNAEREMSPGRGSRLSQILANVPEIRHGEMFDKEKLPADIDAIAKLSLLGLADYLRHNVESHKGVGNAEGTINKKYLSSLALEGDGLQGKINFSEGGSDEARLNQILEKLELGLLDSTSGNARGRYGLGSNNLLFMACEMLLLGKEPEGLPLLLIEEPEAHLHPQRQLRLVEFLKHATEAKAGKEERPIQVILTTHSPNLASKLPLENLVLLEGKKGFSFSVGKTLLEKSDYRFLERFLDVTKANLFFSHGVIIVEGDAEAIVLPVIAKILGRDLTENGISIVSVGGRGLSRFSKIFQRKDDGASRIGIPVACITDMDIMPDCAPGILGLVVDDNDPKWQSATRRWKCLKDLGATQELQKEELALRRHQLQKNDGQTVKTFVAENWTLEYDLAFAGLSKEVHAAASLAKNDDPLNSERKVRTDVEKAYEAEYKALVTASNGDNSVLCSNIFAMFDPGNVSKAIAAQYLAENLLTAHEAGNLDKKSLLAKLPKYLVEAIEHVTSKIEEPKDLVEETVYG